MSKIIFNKADAKKYSKLTGTSMEIIEKQYSIYNFNTDIFSLDDHKLFINKLINKGYNKLKNFSDIDYRKNGETDQFFYDMLFEKLKSKGEYAIIYVLRDPTLFKVWQLIEDFQTGWFKAAKLSIEYYIHNCTNSNNFNFNTKRYDKKIASLSLRLYWYLIVPELSDPSAPKYPIIQEELNLRIIEKTGFSALRHPQILHELSYTWNRSGLSNKATKALNRFYLDMSKEKDRRKWLAYILIKKLKDEQHIKLNIAAMLITDYLYLKTGKKNKSKTFEVNFYRYEKEYISRNFNEEKLIKNLNLEDDIEMGLRFSKINYDYSIQKYNKED